MTFTWPPGGSGSSGSGVTSLNTLTGDVILAAGTNITITPSGNTLTIAAAGASSSGSIVNNFTSDSGTPVRSFVMINGTSEVTVIPDNAVATIPNGIFGVVSSKPTGTSADVVTMGIVTGYSALVVGEPIFVATDGSPTQTPPTTGIIQQVGWAISSTSIFVNILQPLATSP